MAVAAQTARIPEPIGIYESASEAPAFSIQGLNVTEGWRTFKALREVSSFLSNKQHLLVFESKIDNLAQLPLGWDSYGAAPPNLVSIKNAKALLHELVWRALTPSTVVPSAEGGVSLYFFNGDQTSYIDCDNAGSIAFVSYNQHGVVDILELEAGRPASDYVQLLRNYLSL